MTIQHVKYRIDDAGNNNGASCFPTDQALYKALCDNGAKPGAYVVRCYRNEGYFAYNAREHAHKRFCWLKIS